MQQMLRAEINRIIQTALNEDRALHDITSDATIAENDELFFVIRPRSDIVFCGREIITATFAQLKKSTKFSKAKLTLKIAAKDGDKLKDKEIIASGKGNARLILAAERTILNLIQNLSGIATQTAIFKQALNSKKIKILDTRKTTPGLRYLQKYAVAQGGGTNHRFNLSDMILIKDNHISACGGVAKAIGLAKKKRRNGKIKIEVECDKISQVEEAVLCKPDIIMLDNMNAQQISTAAKIIRAKSTKTKIEVSGGVDLAMIKKLSRLDIDFISIGKLTHSIQAADIGLDTA